MSFKEYNILIVDDNPELSELLQSMLAMRGFKTSIGNVDDLEELVQGRNLPDSIVLDMLLAGKDGKEMCSKLKANSVTHHIPIIMISAYPNAEQMCKAAGADDFLVKPFGIAQLVSLLSKNLEGKELQD